MALPAETAESLSPGMVAAHFSATIALGVSTVFILTLNQEIGPQNVEP